MGLKDCPRGLGDLLLDSPPRDPATVTALNVRRLSGDLQSALDYVLQGAAGGSGGGGSSPLVRDGRIDYAAAAQHVQHAVHRTATAGQAAADEAVASTIADAEQRMQQLRLATAALEEEAQAGGSSDSGGLPRRPPPLLADVPSAPAEPAAAPGPSSSGRLGPAEVTLVEAKGGCDINGGCALSRLDPLPLQGVRVLVCPVCCCAMPRGAAVLALRVQAPKPRPCVWVPAGPTLAP